MKINKIFFLPVALLVLSGCNTANQENEAVVPTTDDGLIMETNLAPETSQLVEDETMEGIGQEGRFVNMEMGNFAYSVEEIIVSPGETITVSLTNTEGTHDFDIDELGVDTETVEVGEVLTTTFQIPADAAPGTEYAYYCSAGNHREMGMEGKIFVQ